MKIGSQDGIVASVNRLRDLDPAGTKLKKTASGWPSIATLPSDVSTWKAWDKLERTLQILADDHDEAEPDEGERPPPVPADNYLDAARARIFLANDPLECLAAPEWMVPVCTADLGYRYWYTPNVIDELRDRFGAVEAWCDCRDPTAYSVAEQMVVDLGLNGPAWGQCETTAEFDHAYANGARRMVGSINASVLDADRLALVADAEVLISLEVYCNKDRNLAPDWRGANEGIGGHCIACYESADEGAIYTPVEWYRERGYYVPQRDSVYGVGLEPADWQALA